MGKEDRWATLLNTVSLSEAELIVGLMDSHGIQAVVLDQQSSAYPQIGEVSVMVERDKLLTAKYILDKRDLT